jgi:sugar/nucleoside kinase (ribokinase family)
MARRAFDLIAVGSAVIDHIHRVTVLPKRDAGVMILDRQSGPGGVEGNVAAAAARLGLRVGIICRLGCDRDGTMVLDDFRARGIDVSRVQVGGEEETAYTLIFVDGQGDRIMMTGGRGVRGLTLDAADDAYIRSGRACFASGYLPAPFLKRVVAASASHGGPALAFDLPGEFDDLAARGLRPEQLDALLPAIDLFLTNRDSLRSYTGEPSIESGLERLRAKGVRRASVSDGGRGLSLMDTRANQPEIQHIPGIPVRAVDTTGAGDVLSAALIAAWLLDNQPMEAAGRFAAAAAALSCQGWGVRAGLPTRAEAETLADEGGRGGEGNEGA